MSENFNIIAASIFGVIKKNLAGGRNELNMSAVAGFFKMKAKNLISNFRSCELIYTPINGLYLHLITELKCQV